MLRTFSTNAPVFKTRNYDNKADINKKIKKKEHRGENNGKNRRWTISIKRSYTIYINIYTYRIKTAYMLKDITPRIKKKREKQNFNAFWRRLPVATGA